MKLRLVREAHGMGRLYINNVYLCFTMEDGDGEGDIDAGVYPVLVEFNEEFRQELPRILSDDEYWIYPAKPYGPHVDGVAIGTVRNSFGVVNGFIALEKLLVDLERAYDSGKDIELSIEESAEDKA